MTRRPAGPTGDTSELYAWLLHREEVALQSPGGNLPWTPEQPSYTGTPERLNALQSGEPINLAAQSLPLWARADRGRLQWWHRAIVHPDGGIEFVDDTGEWAAESGL